MSSAPQAFFLPADDASTGQRYCLFHPAQGQVLRGRVVYIHPFAEEMNKSRRMAALQSRALAAAGFSVLQIDLYGCGDSSGDFGDASWQGWVDDVLSACAWLRARESAHAQAPLWLWGLRVGCLIAKQAADMLDEPVNFCFWQPTLVGQQALQQFMRLRLASDMASGGNKGLMGEMRQQLANGQALDIAGYRLPPALADGLQAAQLLPPARRGASRVEWLELSNNPDYVLSPVAEQALKKWQDAGYQTAARRAMGPAFWQTTEIEDAPALIALTLARLDAAGEGQAG